VGFYNHFTARVIFDPSKIFGIQLSLCLTKRHYMKTYWGVEIQFHAFLTSALVESESSAAHPGRFTPVPFG